MTRKITFTYSPTQDKWEGIAMSEVTTAEKIVEDLNDRLCRVRAEKAECARLNMHEAFRALHLVQVEIEKEITHYEN